MASTFKRGGKNNRGGSYYVSWFDHHGRRRTKCAKTTDKATAQRIAAKLESDAALRRDGVIDPALDEIGKQAARTIQSHLADYESKLRAANRTDHYIYCTIQFIRRIAEHAGFQVAADISEDGLTRYAGWLRDEGRGAGTVGAYITAIKGFTRWLSEHDKLPRNPLARVRKPNPKADRRRERRMILPEEWRWLVSAIASGLARYGTTGSERLLLYNTAIQTGLRSNELRSLTRGRLYLDADPPYITCKAGSTKSRKDARQYIQPDLAADLWAHVATKSPRAPMFKMPHETNVASMLRADLADARRAWLKEAKHNPGEYMRREQSDFLLDTNHDGEIIDFHALRHTTGAWLAMAGVHPNVVQVVMRHGSIVMTYDTYGHLFPGQEADAVGQMQEIMAGPPEVLAATGTDHAAVDTPKGAQRRAQHTGRESLLSVADRCKSEGNNQSHDDSCKPLPFAKLDNPLQPIASGSENTPRRDRTPGQCILDTHARKVVP